MEIRAEAKGDEDAIAILITEAFRSARHSAGYEAAIVSRLRTSGTLALSLVGVDSQGVMGHVAASPVLIDGQSGWVGIGPVAVHPSRQLQGNGSALMMRAMDILRARGVKGAVLVGDPDFYRRFGFAPYAGLEVAGVPHEVVLALPFGSDVPHGAAAFDPAFAPGQGAGADSRT